MYFEEQQFLVSIVTVTMNCEATIQRTLDSVRKIKSNLIEYIVIDGHSTDTTVSIVKSSIDLVDVLVSEKDTGIYNAMNKGVSNATGKYIMFINGDDRIVADGFNKAIGILKDKSPEILSCSCDIYSEKNEKLSVLSPNPKRLYFYNSIPHMTTFVLSSLQRKYKFREDLMIASDYDFFVKLYLDGYDFMLSEHVTAAHYQGGASSDVQLSLSEIDIVRKENYSSIIYFLMISYERIKKSLRATLKLCID